MGDGRLETHAVTPGSRPPSTVSTESLIRTPMLSDFRFAFRGLLRSPAFSLAVVLTLALGIGANTAVFSVIDAVLLRALPYGEQDRLVAIWEQRPAAQDLHNVVAPANYLDWKAESRTLEDMGAFVDTRVTLSGREMPEVIQVSYATGSFFSVLGVTPQLGRSFNAQEDGPNGPLVVVLSDEMWRTKFGADPRIVGTTIRINDRPREVVGIMPPGFTLPWSSAQAWLPLALDPSLNYREVSGRYLSGVGRLRPGQTLGAAQTEMSTIARRLEQAHPDFNTGWGVQLVSLENEAVGAARRTLYVLAGVVGLVLLIACANVAHLQLVRATARAREIAVRAALGAGRGRVARHLLAESLLLAAFGGAAGMVTAWWGVSALAAAAPDSLPRASEVQVSGVTLVFTLVLSLVTGLLFGALPAIRASRADLGAALQQGARGSTGRGHVRHVLVALQLALSLVLLVGAGLLVRSFIRISGVDPGFEPEGVLTANIGLQGARYRGNTEAQLAYFDALLGRVRAIPGVRQASVVNHLSFAGGGAATSYWVDGRPAPAPGEEIVADIRGVDADYFRTMGIPLVQGQLFTAADRDTARRVVVISQELARQVFPGMNPVGQRINMPWGDTLRGEIVGVVGDTRHLTLEVDLRPMIYWTTWQFPSSSMFIVIRTNGDPMQLAGLLRSAANAVDPTQALADLRPMTDYLGNVVARRRDTMVLLGLFASVALALAMVGLYGALAFSVAQRTREIGVRMALGAKTREVVRMFLREGMLVVGIGSVVGLTTAFVAARAMDQLLFQVGVWDPITFILAPLTLALVAAAAWLIPARRATRVDPVGALRSD
jgi:putative ABC transport system permease protein